MLKLRVLEYKTNSDGYKGRNEDTRVREILVDIVARGQDGMEQTRTDAVLLEFTAAFMQILRQSPRPRSVQTSPLFIVLVRQRNSDSDPPPKRTSTIKSLQCVRVNHFMSFQNLPLTPSLNELALSKVWTN